MTTLETLSPAMVLIKYRLKRLFNSFAVGLRGKASKEKQRSATGRKGGRGKVMAAFLAGFLLFSVGMQAYKLVEKTLAALGHQQVINDASPAFPAWECGEQRPYRAGGPKVECLPLERPEGSLITEPAARALTLELGLILFGVLLLNLASREWMGAEWDLEWLVTMPVSLSRLIHMRIAERTVANSSGILLVWPFVGVLLWSVRSGFVLSLVLGFFAALMLLLFEASIRTVVDTGLRLFVSVSKLRNLQAVTSLLATGSLFVAMSVTLDEKPFLLRISAEAASSWWRWTPMGLTVQALTATSAATIVESLLLAGVEAVLVFSMASQFLTYLMRNGVVAGGSRESVGLKQRSIKAEPVRNYRWGKLRLSPIQVREMKLLLRDRNFMVQTLILPILVIGMQFFFNRSRDLASVFHGGFTQMAAIAFGAASYSLIFSAFQAVNLEGKSLWMLYTFPYRLEDLLRQKVYLWLFVALLYPLVFFGVGLAMTGWPGPRALLLLLIVLVGIVIHAVVAACFGVFASDPLADDPRQRSRLDYTYLYMILAGFYTYAIFAESYWQKLALVILSTLMALALLQKARDYLPFMLDPTESPKSNVSLSDGLIAALGFFVIQGIMAVLLHRKDQALGGRELLIAFSVAGALMFSAMRIIYWRKKTVGVPQIFGPSLGRAVGIGLMGGVVAGAIGWTYVTLIVRFGFFADSIAKAKLDAAEGRWWIAGMAVIAAPLFEEFIFRGIIFQGLRRSWPVSIASVASAAIFAIVHPPVAVLPVFILGVVAALSYARTGLLIAPIVVHAIYNLMLVVA